MGTILLLGHDGMGEGDTALGQRILKTFLQKSSAIRDLEVIALFNSGAKLVAADSPVLGELAMLEENGIDLMPCGTCLKHFDVTPAVGGVSSMDEIVAAMHKSEKTITL